jgi:uncharacterized repeat protein (TIGR01451 family)
MPRTRIGCGCLTLIAWLAAGPAAGQANGDAAAASSTASGLTLATSIEKLMEVAGADGEGAAELIPVATPLPGDEVVYTVTFTNAKAEAVENVRITSVIPRELRYLEGTAFGPGCQVLYSVDGGRTYGLPAELSVVADDGSLRVATAADYTHIRWVLQTPLDGGAKGFARFGAIVR